MARLASAALCGLLLLPAGAQAADTSDAARAELARERRRLAADVARLADISRRLDTALSQLANASRAVADGVSRADVGADELARREEAVTDAEEDVRSLLEKRRLVADRVVDRKRSIALLEGDLSTRRPADALTGRWTVSLEPGDQRGVFRMSLDGAIVSGDYSLEGGYTGSLKGTLVNDKLRLERVDSKLGFSAVYVGRLARDGGSISGTWESTHFGDGGPGQGRWTAVREEEKEGSQ
jgi:hypothetical protein